MSYIRRPCGFDGCSHPRHYADGYCNHHHRQMVTYGEVWPLGTRPSRLGRPRYIGRAADVAAEVEHLLPIGVEQAIAQLGYTRPNSLYWALRRAKRLDLWRRLREVA